MNDNLNLSEHLFITLFTAYIFSQVIHVVLPTLNIIALFTLMTIIITAILIFTHQKVVQVILFTGIALQLSYVLSWTFSFSTMELTVVGGTFLVLLTLSTFLITEKATNDSIRQSLLAASSISILYLVISNNTFYLLLYLTFPVAVSCIYVSLSKKAEHGFRIVTINTATSIAMAYLMSLLIETPMTKTILLATWISTLLISFMYNNESRLQFMLGYQRFLTQKESLKKEIFLLKRALFNANELQAKELLEVIHSLKDFNRERLLKNLSPGIITRFDLQDKHKQLKSSLWLIVFGAYAIYASIALYISQFSPDYLVAILIFAPLYYLSVPYITSQLLYKSLVRYVNKQFIIPYNKLMDTRNNLKEELSNLLIKRGYSIEEKGRELSSVSATTSSPFGGRMDSHTPNAI